ncbi:MAG TPA: hypothetical protein VMT20_14755, partial [Terriglobia bacterium]|nr:hypothetical protein [Terriglobia bacterium]
RTGLLGKKRAKIRKRTQRTQETNPSFAQWLDVGSLWFEVEDFTGVLGRETYDQSLRLLYYQREKKGESNKLLILNVLSV